MKVHLEGDMECEICKIPFTKQALVCHERTYHPEVHIEKCFASAYARNASHSVMNGIDYICFVRLRAITLKLDNYLL